MQGVHGSDPCLDIVVSYVNSQNRDLTHNRITNSVSLSLATLFGSYRIAQNFDGGKV